MTSSCQTAFTPSTKIPLFTFQHPFSLSLQSGERHRSRVIFPDCQISNFQFFFPSGLGTVHDILKQHIFFFLPLFCDFTCNQLGHPHYLSTSFHFLFWLLSKILFQNFQFFFPDISIFTLLGNYIWLLNFLVNPSRTAIDQYCHIMTSAFVLVLFRLTNILMPSGLLYHMCCILTRMLGKLHSEKHGFYHIWDIYLT